MRLHSALGFFCCLFLTFIPNVAQGATASAPQSIEGHVFYYGWYGNPDADGAWRAWNHHIFLRDGLGAAYTPPEDIGANFYPADGLYSSNNRDDIARQMRQIKQAGCGVIAATWWGQNDYTDTSLELLFDVAAEHDLQVCFHVEPFPGRNAETVREALVYLLDKYRDHPALYRCAILGDRPLIYLYDSYLSPASDWAAIFQPDGANTIRGTDYDVVAIALWVKQDEAAFMLEGGFDGFYTYFATDGFTYGSTPANWPRLARWARRHDLLFIPSVGPGYIDTRIRPWNEENTRDRENGAYYDRMFEAALDLNVPIVSITSFNEWHEGTQIEPAMPKEIPGYVYEDYGDRAPDYYLDRTRYWLSKPDNDKE